MICSMKFHPQELHCIRHFILTQLRILIYAYFYFADGILLGGIFILYEMQNFLRPVLFILYSFWIPQIISNVIRDTRKPLHPYYIVGMTVTRLAVPLYVFGCPSNFLRIEVDYYWCIYLGVFIGLQAIVLLIQHYLGSRCFIPSQVRVLYCASYCRRNKLNSLSFFLHWHDGLLVQLLIGEVHGTSFY